LLESRVDLKTGEKYYSFVLEEMQKLLQERMIDRILEQTLGRYHKRIYRVLDKHGSLEEATIRKFSCLPIAEVHKILNQLYKEGIVKINFVETQNSNRKIITYSLLRPRVNEYMRSKLRKTLFNMMTFSEGLKKVDTVLTHEEEEAKEAKQLKVDCMIQALIHQIVLFR